MGPAWPASFASPYPGDRGGSTQPAERRRSGKFDPLDAVESLALVDLLSELEDLVFESLDPLCERGQ